MWETISCFSFFFCIFLERDNIYNDCIGCLNRICITDNKEEVLTMLASLQTKAMILGKNTFLRIDEESELD